ncbi:helix-turn-helix transcriptional regulator [Leuconostoc gelidum subsp. aenigmaticum]|uniref:helix-turn-helix domain-containing protein n=1 Tax=Leuconostoc gelidum TaxID=1244 RepID=UPI001CC71EF2|nr:helix-turn-helix transcriptional regulator [Leuconostoc gelidum]MBZ6003911.1 helix-turn-helix transcriptional regulator [Leuconostoc gelidum subsp. aenigmaticum]
MINNYGCCELNEEALSAISGGSSENIAQNLKTLRITSCLSREKLAERLNIDLSTIAKYEEGARIPDIDMIIDLAHIFHTNINNIVF